MRKEQNGQREGWLAQVDPMPEVTRSQQSVWEDGWWEEQAALPAVLPLGRRDEHMESSWKANLTSYPDNPLPPGDQELAGNTQAFSVLFRIYAHTIPNV